MKKYLPVFLFLIGLVVVIGAYFFVIKPRKEEPIEEEETARIEVPLEKRPITSLTPSSDGHWLYLKIEKIEVDAASLDYELLYKVPDGRTQGVPGTISLEGQKEIERDLLLGSESSGKFRYDEGVEQGTFTLRFRNEKGKLIAKFSTEFSLLSDTKELTTPGGGFGITLSEIPKSGFFVLMETFGIPSFAPKEMLSGPYGLFSSADIMKLSGTVKVKDNIVYMHVTGPRWTAHNEGDVFDSDTGIFVGSSE